jgi:hypothetical protein
MIRANDALQALAFHLYGRFAAIVLVVAVCAAGQILPALNMMDGPGSEETSLAPRD